MSSAGSGPPTGSALKRRVSLGAVAVALPILLYPGDWASVAPVTPEADMAWTGLGLAVLVTVALGLTWIGWAFLDAARVRSDNSEEGVLAALGVVLLARRNRVPLILSAVGYASLFVFFTGTLSFGAGVETPDSPAAFLILCCGPPGLTPGFVVEIPPAMQLSTNPLSLVLLVVGVVLFSANLTSVVELARRSSPARTATASGVLGAAGTLLVGCPSCGTILAASILEGTVVGGLLTGWAVLQWPLFLSAIPLALAGLWVVGRRLSRPAACGRRVTPV